MNDHLQQEKSRLTRDKEHRDRLAREAERLCNEPLLIEALENMKQNAMINLVSVNTSEIDEILQWQAIAKCVDGFKDSLTHAIIAGKEDNGGYDPNKLPSEQDKAQEKD